MTEDEMRAYAVEWEASWNAHDLGRILSHYTDDVQFRSRKAIPTMGTGLINGKDALQAYWSGALERQPDLRFTVTNVFLGADMMVIGYTNHRGVEAAETLYFNAHGKVYQAAACHAGN